jgi:hypothetical protein
MSIGGRIYIYGFPHASHDPFQIYDDKKPIIVEKYRALKLASKKETCRDTKSPFAPTISRTLRTAF